MQSDTLAPVCSASGNANHRFNEALLKMTVNLVNVHEGPSILTCATKIQGEKQARTNCFDLKMLMIYMLAYMGICNS